MSGFITSLILTFIIGLISVSGYGAYKVKRTNTPQIYYTGPQTLSDKRSQRSQISQRSQRSQRSTSIETNQLKDTPFEEWPTNMQAALYRKIDRKIPEWRGLVASKKRSTKKKHSKKIKNKTNKNKNKKNKTREKAKAN